MFRAHGNYVQGSWESQEGLSGIFKNHKIFYLVYDQTYQNISTEIRQYCIKKILPSLQPINRVVVN